MLVRRARLKATRVPALASEPTTPAPASRPRYPEWPLSYRSGSGRGPGTFAHSYPLKRQVPLLKVQMEEVAYEGQAEGSRRVVLRAPPFEEISKEEKGDGPQQDSAGTENGPEGNRQGAHRCEHGGDLGSLFRGLIQRRSRRLSASKLPALPSFPACPRPRPAPPRPPSPTLTPPRPYPGPLGSREAWSARPVRALPQAAPPAAPPTRLHPVLYSPLPSPSCLPPTRCLWPDSWENSKGLGKGLATSVFISYLACLSVRPSGLLGLCHRISERAADT